MSVSRALQQHIRRTATIVTSRAIFPYFLDWIGYGARPFTASVDSVWGSVSGALHEPDSLQPISFVPHLLAMENNEMVTGMKAFIKSSSGVAAASLFAAAFATPAADTQHAIPPKAAQVTGPIQQVELGPVLADRYLCVEHALELEYAGDALGTDCVLSGGVEIGRNGYLKLYRTDGATNADWYGWHADVLAPFGGTVVYLHHDTQENVPGVLGPSSAGSLRFRNEDGVIVTYGHVTQIAVKVGDSVKEGQIVAKLGNNGQNRAPGIHIGAYREADAMPLQIRWDLRAMAKKRAEAGIR